MTYNVGEVWFAAFPVEDNEGNHTGDYTARPVIVLHENHETLEVLSVKVTTHKPRPNDPYDTPIIYWQQAQLRFESTARVVKTDYIPMSLFKRKLGDLHPDDLLNIQTLYMQLILSRKAASSKSG